MSNSESESENLVEECPQCFRRGYFQKGEVCDGCANIDEYYELCSYCDEPNYTNDDICAECLKTVNNLNNSA